jgi:hypothetical protein
MLFGIVAWLCWIHKQIWAQYPTSKKDLAIDFLNSFFNSNIDNRQSIGSAVFMEFTLIIVACKRAQKWILPKKLYSIYNAKDNAMVFSAACFCHRLKRRLVWGFLRGWQLRRPTQICLLELTVCHYNQASDNGIAPSPRQNRNKRDSWRCGDIPSIHNSTGFPILQVMWIQANQSLKWEQLWIVATVSPRTPGRRRCFVVVG